MIRHRSDDVTHGEFKRGHDVFTQLQPDEDDDADDGDVTQQSHSAHPVLAQQRLLVVKRQQRDGLARGDHDAAADDLRAAELKILEVVPRALRRQSNATSGEDRHVRPQHDAGDDGAQRQVDEARVAHDLSERLPAYREPTARGQPEEVDVGQGADQE